MKPLTVCLLSPGQPSTNPRLVKEADALSEAGHDVEALCGVWVPWAVETDRRLMRDRSWKLRYVGGSPDFDTLRYQWTRVRFAAARRLGVSLWGMERRLLWGLSRVGSELARAAAERRADLYIAHYPGALVAAARAARGHGSRLGFDLEDLYSDGSALDSQVLARVEACERRYLPLCDFVTAASPGIARAYSKKYGIREPFVILNVFPLTMRPRQRPSAVGQLLRIYWFSQTIGPDRGLEDAVAALSHLPHGDVELHLRGVWQTGYEDQLRGLASRLGVPRQAIVSHPPIPPDELVRDAARFDVGLAAETGRNQNRRIAVTNKFFAYLLAGNAIAATRTEGQMELGAELGSAVQFYSTGKAEELAGVLRLWLTERERLQEARNSSWNWGERRFNWDLEKEKFLALVRNRLKVDEPYHERRVTAG